MSVSTHVLDTVHGVPAVQISVHLTQQSGDHWLPIGDGHTDAGGRVVALAGDLAPGVYRLSFDVEGYLGTESFFPEVTITFRILDGTAHHHVPLLLSPYGYTTYRGS